MSKRAAIFASVICLILIILIIGKVYAQDCPEGCSSACESGICLNKVVAHLGKYTMQSQGWTKTPTITPTITATPKPTLTPTITTLPGIIVYLNTTPELPAAPVLDATLTPLPTIATSPPQGTAIFQYTSTVEATIVAVLAQTQTTTQVDSLIGPKPTPTSQIQSKVPKSIFSIAWNTILQWTLWFREAIKNTVWVSVITILLVLLGIYLLGFLITKIIDGIRISRGVIGPIQVEENEDKPGLASQIYKYLSECGASCQNSALTSSPSATPGFSSVTAAVKEVAPVESKVIELIVAIFSFLIGISSFKKRGYSVLTHISGEDEKKNIKLNVVINLINKQKFKDSRVFSGTSTEEVVKEAAYWVFWYVSGRRKSRAHLAPWEAFPTFESFYNYKKAVCEKVLEKANELFKEASKEAPFNALINLSWGDKNELNNHYIEALKIYLEGIMMWPHLLSFWYRFAVILDCYPKWSQQLVVNDNPLSDEDKKKKTIKEELNLNAKTLIDGILKETIEDYFKTDKKDHENDNDNDNDIQNCMDTFNFADTNFILQLANIVWLYIENILNTSISLLVGQARINIFTPWQTIDYSPALARYYWSLIPFFHLRARQTRKSVNLAHCCTKVEQFKIDNPKESIYSIDDMVRQISNSWCTDAGVFYNVSCYYALRSEILFESYSTIFGDILNNYPIKIIKNQKFYASLKQIQNNELFLTFFKIDDQIKEKEKNFVSERDLTEQEQLLISIQNLKNITKAETDNWSNEEIKNLLQINNEDKEKISQYFTLFMLNESVRNHFIKESMKYLKISFKEHQPNLTLDWVRNDPDLDPLWGEIEFQALFDIPLEKTHKDFKKKDCEKKIAGLKVADAICTVIAKKEAYTYSNITPEFLMTVSKSEIDLWDSLSAFLKEPEKEKLMIHFHDLANQLYDIKLGDPILSIPPECEIPSDDSIENEQENEIDYFSIFEKINQNCDQLSTHAQDHAQDWKNKLETSKLFITHEQVPNLVDVWKIWERASAWQWVSIEKELSTFINKIDKEMIENSDPKGDNFII